MHLVITKVELKPGAHPAFQELFDNRAPAVLGECRGWRGAEVSIDRGTNTVFAVGYWEDETQMREFLATPEHAALIQELAVHFAGAPEVAITEVASRVGALAG